MKLRVLKPQIWNLRINKVFVLDSNVYEIYHLCFETTQTPPYLIWIFVISKIKHNHDRQTSHIKNKMIRITNCFIRMIFCLQTQISNISSLKREKLRITSLKTWEKIGRKIDRLNEVLCRKHLKLLTATGYREYRLNNKRRKGNKKKIVFTKRLHVTKIFSTDWKDAGLKWNYSYYFCSVCRHCLSGDTLNRSSESIAWRCRLVKLNTFLWIRYNRLNEFLYTITTFFLFQIIQSKHLKLWFLCIHLCEELLQTQIFTKNCSAIHFHLKFKQINKPGVSVIIIYDQ